MERIRVVNLIMLVACCAVANALGTARGDDELQGDGRDPMKSNPRLETDVLPILTKNCMGCHGGLRRHGELDLRTLPAMLRGGESGPAIQSGHADQSELWKRIAADEMPEGDDREKLSAAEKQTIKAWIDAGMPTLSQQQQNLKPLLPPGMRHSVADVSAAIDDHLGRFLDSAGLQPTARTEDDAFVRRLYLDLTGRVPSADAAAGFLDSQAADKREQLIDALLATPEFGEQFGRTWRDWVCPPELPSDNNGGAQPYEDANRFGKWLGEKLVAGQPWDKIVREIVTVRGETKQHPQAIFFGLVGRGGQTTADGSARAVASLFMGVQLQCARCHDDPYRDWSQQEHWALAAFFGRAQGNFKKIEIGKGPSKNPGEIAIPGDAFKNSGAIVKTGFLRGAAFPAGAVKQQDDLRAALADWLTAKDNPYFATALVNRLWFYFFARGIVNPIDDFRELNPPSHPALLNLLAAEFTASDYDVKHLIRCICGSQAYQRSSRAKPDTDSVTRTALTTAFGRMPMRVMTADMLYDSLKLAYGDPKLDLRTDVKDSQTGQAAPVANPYLEFQRRFGTNEEDATDFTHGIAQMLTLINHPRLLAGGKSLDEYLKRKPEPQPPEVIQWLYLSTLSRRPSEDESREAETFVTSAADPKRAYQGILWMLVNRSEYLLIR